MIRPAKFFDTMRIIELMHEMYEQSRYREIDKIDDKAAHRLVAQCIQRHGHTNDGGALVMVAVRDMKVEGFIIGMLDRLYHIGEKLMASDVFLYCSDKAKPGQFLQLLSEYVSWAESNPKVREIKLSYTDALPGTERIEQVYERLGFRKCGGIWSKGVEEITLGVAA